MNNLVLVGFMGSGKSLISRKLGQRLNRSVIDTDKEIEILAQKCIAEIFSQEGEPAFREWETTVLKRLVDEQTQGAVIATGGGIVLKTANWDYLHRLGCVIGLQAGPETILKRVGQGEGRPLLQGSREEVWQRINRLLLERSSAYAKADKLINTDNLTPDQVVENIHTYISKQRME